MKVTVDIFSGRKNPSWHPEEKNARELIERLKNFLPNTADLLESSQLGPRKVFLELEPNESTRYALPTRFAFRVDDAKSVMKQETLLGINLNAGQGLKRETMEWLISTPECGLDDHTKNAVSSLMRRDETGLGQVQTDAQKSANALVQTTGLKAEIGGGVCSPFLPPMWLQYWNTLQIQPTNNCYNYASNVVTFTQAQPGRFSGHMYTSFSCANVRDAAFADGVEPACNGIRRVIALVIWPGIDFHWYRMHPNSFWAHKVGWNAATNLDNSGQIIGNTLSPENCDRGPYSLFCGYYFAPLGMRVL